MAVPAFAIEIDNYPSKTITYSVCTLVSDHVEYGLMVKSFIDAGFDLSSTEFIYIDNTKSNKYDAYQGLNKSIVTSRGEYIILCHQDIELRFDKRDILEERIKEVEALDPNWGIISNAGGVHLKKTIERISHVDHELNEGPFPCLVKSVDENFMLIKRSSNLGFSSDLRGFHMYGTDICILANILGYNAWVIDFHLFHKSNGNMNESFFNSRNALIKKYNHAFRPRYIRSTCTRMFISGNRMVVFLMNTKVMVFIYKLHLKIKRRIKGSYIFEG
ncbi:MAG TPA: hypothetical protein VF691_02270 [Cytophagaceae bacterium]|jgi:hypothetical protein